MLSAMIRRINERLALAAQRNRPASRCSSSVRRRTTFISILHYFPMSIIPGRQRLIVCHRLRVARTLLASAWPMLFAQKLSGSERPMGQFGRSFTVRPPFVREKD
jgi:hypothetical protein